MNSTSLSLLEKMRSPEADEGWRRFEKLYRPWLRRWLPRLLPAADVDDVLQEVLAVLCRELPRFEHNGQKGAFRRWLRGVVVNRLREFRRGQAAEFVADSAVRARLEELALDHTELTERWNREHDRHVLDQLLRQVAGDFEPATWRAFRGLALEGRSARELAEALGLSEGAVWSAKSRVLKRLRDAVRGLVDVGE